MNRVHLLFIFTLFVPSLFAELAHEDIVELEVIALSNLNPPELYYIAPDGEMSPLPVGKERRSSPVKWRYQSELIMFAKSELPNDSSSMQPVFEVAIPDRKDRVIVFLYLDSGKNIRTRAVASNSDSHPALSARLINLTEVNIGCALGEQVIRLDGSSDTVVPMNVSANERFRFGFQFLDADKMPTRSPMRTLRFLNDKSRFTAIFAYQQSFIENMESHTVMKPHVFRLYDNVSN